MTAAVLATPRVVIPQPAPNSPDADLIRLCTEYVALSMERDRILLSPENEPFVSIVSRLAELEPAIGALPASTDEGVQAKAAAVMYQMAADGDPAKPRETNDAPAHSLALDLLRPRPVLALGAAAVPSPLVGLADRIEAGQRELAAMASAEPDADYESGPNAAILQGWWDLTNTVRDQPITCAADVLALARICRSLWAQTPGDDCDLRDALDQKLQRAVIERFSKPDPDAALIALCTKQSALLAEANHVGNIGTPGEALDRELNRLVGEAYAVADTIATMHATTPAGIVALARTTAAAAEGMLIDNDTDPLLKMLFRDSLALDGAHALPGVGAHPDAELLALHDRFIVLEAQSLGLCRSIPDDDARAIAQEPITAEQDGIVARTWDLTATTLDGHRARARMLAAWDGELLKTAIERRGLDAEICWLLVRDLLGEDHADALQSRDLAVYQKAIEAGLSGAAVGVPLDARTASSQDAAIIALCDRAAERRGWRVP